MRGGLLRSRRGQAGKIAKTGEIPQHRATALDTGIIRAVGGMPVEHPGQRLAHLEIGLTATRAEQGLLAPGMERVNKADDLDAIRCQCVQRAFKQGDAAGVKIIAQIEAVNPADTAFIALPLGPCRIGVGPGHARRTAADIIGHQLE